MKKFERQLHKDVEEFYKTLCLNLNKKLRNKNIVFDSSKTSILHQNENDHFFYEISISYEMLGDFYKIYYNDSSYDFYSIYAYSFDDLVNQVISIINLHDLS